MCDVVSIHDMSVVSIFLEALKKASDQNSITSTKQMPPYPDGDLDDLNDAGTNPQFKNIQGSSTPSEILQRSDTWNDADTAVSHNDTRSLASGHSGLPKTLGLKESDSLDSLFLDRSSDDELQGDHSKKSIQTRINKDIPRSDDSRQGSPCATDRLLPTSHLSSKRSKRSPQVSSCPPNAALLSSRASPPLDSDVQISANPADCELPHNEVPDSRSQAASPSPQSPVSTGDTQIHPTPDITCPMSSPTEVFDGQFAEQSSTFVPGGDLNTTMKAAGYEHYRVEQASSVTSAFVNSPHRYHQGRLLSDRASLLPTDDTHERSGSADFRPSELSLLDDVGQIRNDPLAPLEDSSLLAKQSLADDNSADNDSNSSNPDPQSTSPLDVEPGKPACSTSPCVMFKEESSTSNAAKMHDPKNAQHSPYRQVERIEPQTKRQAESDAMISKQPLLSREGSGRQLNEHPITSESAEDQMRNEATGTFSRPLEEPGQGSAICAIPEAQMMENQLALLQDLCRQHELANHKSGGNVGEHKKCSEDGCFAQSTSLVVLPDASFEAAGHIDRQNHGRRNSIVSSTTKALGDRERLVIGQEALHPDSLSPIDTAKGAIPVESSTVKIPGLRYMDYVEEEPAEDEFSPPEWREINWQPKDTMQGRLREDIATNDLNGQSHVRKSIEPETPRQLLYRDSTPAFEDRSRTPSPRSIPRSDLAQDDVAMADVLTTQVENEAFVPERGFIQSARAMRAPSSSNFYVGRGPAVQGKGLKVEKTRINTKHKKSRSKSTGNRHSFSSKLALSESTQKRRATHATRAINGLNEAPSIAVPVPSIPPKLNASPTTATNKITTPSESISPTKDPKTTSKVKGLVKRAVENFDFDVSSFRKTKKVVEGQAEEEKEENEENEHRHKHKGVTTAKNNVSNTSNEETRCKESSSSSSLPSKEIDNEKAVLLLEEIDKEEEEEEEKVENHREPERQRKDDSSTVLQIQKRRGRRRSITNHHHQRMAIGLGVSSSSSSSKKKRATTPPTRRSRRLMEKMQKKNDRGD